MSKIGFMMWEPGLQSKSPTSAGGAQWVSYLFTQLVKNGHEVIWLADGDAPQCTRKGIAQECNVVFFFWRWRMPWYPERNEAYERQWRLILDCSDNKIPVIVHDQDHKISDDDMWELGMEGAILTAPELFPRPGFRTLMFPDPFEAVKQQQLKLPVNGTDLVYIGNNYERYEQARKFFGVASHTICVDVYGNWLEEGVGRERPEQVIHDMPKVNFKGRLPQEQTIPVMMDAQSTIHLFKQSYGPTGFVTIRWAEAVAAQTIAFVPRSFKLPLNWQGAFNKNGLIVESGGDLVYNYINMSHLDLIKAYAVQREFVIENMTVSGWLKLIDEVTK